MCRFALALCVCLLPSLVLAQESGDVEQVSIPPLPVGAPPAIFDAGPEVEPGFSGRPGLEQYQGRFLSPKCEPGRCAACERASGGCCCTCLTKSIWHLLPGSCLKKSEGCACPPHFFCPRGHCRVRYTECTRIDYRPYKTVMEPARETKAETADYTKAKPGQPIAIDLYPVYEPCCQDFWLEDDLMYADDCPSCCNE
jgi:hypothetical protein